MKTILISVLLLIIFIFTSCSFVTMYGREPEVVGENTYEFYYSINGFTGDEDIVAATKETISEMMIDYNFDYFLILERFPDHHMLASKSFDVIKNHIRVRFFKDEESKNEFLKNIPKEIRNKVKYFTDEITNYKG